MTEYEAQDPDYKARVQSTFDNTRAMKTLGVSLDTLEPGHVQFSMPHNPDFTQQHGFIHAGVISTALDNACGCAAYTLMPATAHVLTVEFKTNLLAPAKGENFLFIAKVKKPGRTITVCDAEAWAVSGDDKKLVATMTATLMALIDRDL